MSSIPEIEVTDAAKNMSITEGPADPWCDEKNPRIVDFEKISAAAYRIHGGIVKTPCDVGSSYNLFFCWYCNLIFIIVSFFFCPVLLLNFNQNLLFQRSHIQQDGMEIYLKKDFMQYTG